MLNAAFAAALLLQVAPAAAAAAAAPAAVSPVIVKGEKPSVPRTTR